MEILNVLTNSFQGAYKRYRYKEMWVTTSLNFWASVLREEYKKYFF